MSNDDTAIAAAQPEQQMTDEAFYGLFIASQSSEQTQRGYDGSIRDFGIFLSGDSRPWTAADVVRILRAMDAGQANMIVTGYRVYLERRYKPNTVNVRLAALRSMIGAAKRFGLITWELDVSGVRARTYRDTSGPGFELYKRMLERVDARGDTPKARRDRSILRLLHDSGLRRGEVVRLNLDDVTPGEITTIKVTGKGYKDDQKITLPTKSAEAINSWIEVRGSEPGPLFHNLDTGSRRARLTGRGVYGVVRAYGASVGATVRPHGLRHSAITRAADRTNGNLLQVARFSRHRSLNTVQVYLDNLKDDGGTVAEIVAADG